MNRSRLGAALRELRQASGKEAKVVARGAVMSPSKLSKIETGKVPPTVVDVERILTAIGVSEEVKAAYMATARAEATETTAWRLIRRLGYHRKQQQIKALDDSTRLLRLFQPSLVPGLLQTPEYVRAVFGRRDLTEEQLSRAVAARLARQQSLYDATKTLQFVITEPVLRWRLVPPAMMAGQLDRIISVSRLPHVDIRIVPLAAPQVDVPAHSFAIRDDRMVTVETVHAEVMVTDPRDVEMYVHKFDRFAAAALSGDEMRRMVEGVRDEFLREQESC
ncbi:helix-turn-helix transcriptional regulator [Streptomyces sp. CB01881]|uniref:helix-turn-helix domain-containing protein n=1 Tax=Streptomyces sp. CB01881 TaxID=2078691 RepID=UPI000CDCB129|nr:helix-turn-helix transcriptional regulator [Streptomyces sp. CB01881]AUY50670.1 transcriptional regulator [Streptomyces sp. CB01881]TYC74057.1 XRE family transcriptional regulator [Streptomyces sp. CB01881]